MSVFEKMRKAQVPADGNSPWESVEAAHNSILENAGDDADNMSLNVEVSRK